MKQQDLTKLSQEELMERIKTRCAQEKKRDKLTYGLILFNLVWMSLYMVLSNNTARWEFPLFLIILLFAMIEAMIEALIDGWSYNRLSKCDDAGTLVDTYENYLKFDKAHLIVVAVVAVLIASLIFSGILPLMVKSPLLVGFLICCIPLGSLGAFNRRKSAIAQEIDRLRKLIGN
ncbi:MAG: hypothetical protein IJV11_11605 [Muribaculaceae bacterium]|nr:hypothetical protein [Muribaculaceae bacterium]